MGADEMDLRAGFPLFETVEVGTVEVGTGEMETSGMHEAWICTSLRTFMFRLQAFSVAQPFPYSLKLEVCASKPVTSIHFFSFPVHFRVVTEEHDFSFSL